MMARPTQKEMVQFGPWPEGANNVARQDTMPTAENGAQVAFRRGRNVDVYPGGKVRRRKGTALVQGSGGDGGWASEDGFAMYRAGTALMQFVPGHSPVMLHSGLSPDAPMTYCSTVSAIYVSDTHTALRVNPVDGSVAPWGIETPPGQPVLTASSSGGMDAGTYQVAMTYLTSSGEESGTGVAATVDVPEGGGIEVASVPAPADSHVTDIALYRTTANGSELRRCAVIPANATSGHLYHGPLLEALETQHYQRMPAGSSAVFSAGRLVVARGNVVVMSRPGRPGLYWPKEDWVQYAAEAILLGAGNADGVGAQAQGVYIAAGTRTFFLDPATGANRVVYHAGAVPGTQTVMMGTDTGLDGMPGVLLPVWLANDGIVCMGTPDGQVVGLTSGRYVLNTSARGAAVLRELDGIKQVIFALEPPSSTSRATTSDSLVITRRKHGNG